MVSTRARRHARSSRQDVSRGSGSGPCGRCSLWPPRARRRRRSDAPPCPERKTQNTAFFRQPQKTKPKQASAEPPKHLLLNYTYVPDILEKRGPYREAHLAGAQKKLDERKLVCAGAVGAPPKGATFFFKGASRAEVEQFVKDDAYVQNGLVTAWSIEPYTVVVGDP